MAKKLRVRNILQFFEWEFASVALLFTATVAAMVWANSSFQYIHQHFINTFLFTINDGLMAFFFLMVSLELKRGFYEDDFATPSVIALPLCAALGGMILPALIYVMINWSHPLALHGWAAPVATDIAFALGVLSLFGNRIPAQLKLFLLALAIFDDIGAILIIVFFYSGGLQLTPILIAALTLILLALMQTLKIKRLVFYLAMGVVLWLALLHSGIHPTLAGVLLGLFIPYDKIPARSLVNRLENHLRPIVGYAILPLFALTNAGFAFESGGVGSLFSTISIGIIAGLFLGKQFGVFGASYLLIKMKVAKLPANTSWTMLYGVAILCGIGFTMSLFLGTLSFGEDSPFLTQVRLGVLVGSILSGIVAAFILHVALKRPINKKGRNNT